MEFLSNRFILKEVSNNDLNEIHNLNSIPEVDKYNTLGLPVSIKETRDLVIGILESQNAIPRIRYVFIISEMKSDNFIGLAGLVIGKPNYLNAEIWYKIHPDYWNKGMATEAVEALLHFAFNNLKLHRIEAGCAIKNIGSIKVLQKSGFIREGHSRKLLPIRGEWVDNFNYAILEDDYFKNNLS